MDETYQYGDVGFEREAEWWPENLVPIESEFTALYRAGYVICGLLAKAAGESRLRVQCLDLEPWNSGKTLGERDLVRLWDRRIGEARSSGVMVVGMVMLSFSGDLKAVPYADWPEMIEAGITTQTLDRGVALFLDLLRYAAGLSRWPIVRPDFSRQWFM